MLEGRQGEILRKEMMLMQKGKLTVLHSLFLFELSSFPFSLISTGPAASLMLAFCSIAVTENGLDHGEHSIRLRKEG